MLTIEERDHKNEVERRYYYKNRERILRRMRERYTTPPRTEKRRAYERAYQYRNREQLNEVSRLLRRVKGQRTTATGICSRAKKKGMEADFKHLVSLSCPAICPALGSPISFGTPKGTPSENVASFDRIDSRLGYVSGNVQIISYLANAMKNRATRDQLDSFANWIMETRNA